MIKYIDHSSVWLRIYDEKPAFRKVSDMTKYTDRFVKIHDENFTPVDENIWNLVIVIARKSNSSRNFRLVDEN